MAGSLEAVNKKPSSLTADNESSSQDMATDAWQSSAPTELTASKAAFEAAISANYDLASTVLGTLQTKARVPTDDHLQGTEAHRVKATNVRAVLEMFQLCGHNLPTNDILPRLDAAYQIEPTLDVDQLNRQLTTLNEHLAATTDGANQTTFDSNAEVFDETVTAGINDPSMQA